MATVTLRLTTLDGDPVADADVYINAAGADLGNGPIGTTDAQGEIIKTVGAGFDRLVRGKYTTLDGNTGSFEEVMKAGEVFEVGV